MRAERICSIARFAMGLPAAAAPDGGDPVARADPRRQRRPAARHSRRRSWRPTPCWTLYLNVVPGLVVHPAVIARHVADELPFMATENLLMAAVQAGGDRQDLHERIRTHSLAAAARLKEGDGAQRPDRPAPARPGLPAARLRRRPRPAPVRRPRPRAGRRRSSPDEVEPIRRRYPASSSRGGRDRRLTRCDSTGGDRERDRPAVMTSDRYGLEPSGEAANGPRARRTGRRDPARNPGTQTRAAWRALRRRFSSSRRRRSLGFS